MPPRSSRASDLDADVASLPLDNGPQSSPLPSKQVDLTSTISLWKANPKLYIQQERQKTMIRTRDEKMMARAAAGQGPIIRGPKFPQFKRLPLELRLMIWEFSTRVPRVVEFNSCTTRYKLASRTSVPAVIHCNKESRKFGLQYYDKVSTYDLDKNVGVTFIKWELDVVLFISSKALGTFLSRPTKVSPAFRCHNLAIRDEDMTMLSSSPRGSETQLSRVQELVLTWNMTENTKSTTDYILSASPEFVNDEKTIDAFKEVMSGYKLPDSIIVRSITRKDILTENDISMKKRSAMEDRYDSDLLLAAQLQEELDRRT